MKWIKNNIEWLSCVWLLLMITTVFGPLELYLTNYSEFWFDFDEVIKISTVLTLMCGSVLILIPFFLKKKYRSIYGSFVFAVAICLYVQGNFINIDYGTLDGTAINWKQYSGYSFVNTTVWLLYFAGVSYLMIKKPNFFARVKKVGSLLISCMLLVSLGIIIVSNDIFSTQKSDFYLSSEGIYEVSDHRNIVLFVLDSFDAGYFQDLYENEKIKYEEIFEDFTYFDNASVAAARTNAALPAILTGKPYPGEIEYLTYISEGFNFDGLYSELNNQNYDVRIYTEADFIPDNVGSLVKNQVSTGFEISSYFDLSLKYFDLVLYKYVPHTFKQYFWIYTGDLDKYKTGTDAVPYTFDDAEFLNSMNLKVSDSEKNSFRLFHLNGAHSPYILNEKGEVKKETTLLQQAKGSLYIVESYINQMKQLGVYEDSTIIVMADHGEASDLYQNDSAAHGILFYKESGANREFTVLSTPVSYYNLHATLYSELGKDIGETFYDVIDDNRTRMFYRYTTSGGHFVLEEYIVYGNLKDKENVKATGVKYEPNIGSSIYELGKQLTFGLDSNAFPFIIKGISGTDVGNYTWTTGKDCEFEFEFANSPTSDLVVTIDLMAVYTPEGPQTVKVYANDVYCYEDKLDNSGVLRFIVSKSVVQEDNVLHLRLELPDAVSPVAILGPGNDDRELSLAISGMKIEALNNMITGVYSPSQEITFGNNGTVKEYVLSGINSAEETDYSWVNGHEVVMFLPFEGIPTSDLEVAIDVMHVYAENGPQRVIITANGNSVYQTVMEKPEKLEFVIPQEFVKDSYLTLQIELPDAISPYETNGGSDLRELSLALHGMIVKYDSSKQSDLPSDNQNIIAIVGAPLALLLNRCYELVNDYALAIILFTLLTKVILLPVSMWVQRNGIAMVKITPELNQLKIKYYGDKDMIADETQTLYKKEKYNPLASTLPMIVQLVMLFGVIGAVKTVLGDADTVLTMQPAQIGGLAWLMPLAAGGAALALGLAQNRLNPLQREQNRKEQWISNGFSIGISLSLGAFVSIGVCIYWIASNLLSILQQYVLNLIIKPEKYIDYEKLEESKLELNKIDSLSKNISKEDKRREKHDYKKFFSVANKHLVFYSEKSGFYKYFKDVLDFLLENSNVIIHYVTNDPKDQIFEIAKIQTRIKPYFISENKLITLFMKMDSDIVVMTCPDLEKYHLKRSYVRKDIEYIYMFHYPLSTHMVLNTGALDNYDTIFCVGDFQFDEIRNSEKIYGTPEKKLISAGYGQLEQLHKSYMSMEKVSRKKPKILIAPSWQYDNILDNCIDGILEQLLDKGYEVVVRPHPEYVKRYKPRMDAIVQRYQGREDSGLKFELDFTSNDSLFNSDILISDWSGSAYEFSLVTLKPSIFIDTTPKINNPEYEKIGIEPLEFKLRDEVGVRVKPTDLSDLDKKIDMLFNNSDMYAQKIKNIREKYIANFGNSGEVGGKYILSQLLEKQNKKKG